MQCGDNLQYNYSYGKLAVQKIEHDEPAGEMWDDCSPRDDWELESVHISEGVTTIGDNCFADQPLSELYLPNSLESIGENAFAGCQNLEEVDIPNGIESIGDRAFADTGIESIEIPASVKNIEYGAFENCDNLSFVSVNAESIGENAFSNSAIKELNIGKNVHSIGDGAFQHNDIQNKVNLTHVSELGDHSFYGNMNAEFVANENQLPDLQKDGLNAHTPSLEDIIADATEIATAENSSISFETHDAPARNMDEVSL